MIGEYDENGAEIQGYGYQPDSEWTTDPLFLKQGESFYFYLNDHLGTPQKVVGRNGVVVWAAEFEAFGKANVTVNSIDNPLRFPGQYFDKETQTHYNFHRDYDPVLGQYLTEDPIGFTAGDENLYRYVQNNPVNLIDPTGKLTAVEVVITFGAVVALGTSIGIINTINNPFNSPVESSPLPRSDPFESRGKDDGNVANPPAKPLDGDADTEDDCGCHKILERRYSWHQGDQIYYNYLQCLKDCNDKKKRCE